MSSKKTITHNTPVANTSVYEPLLKYLSVAPITPAEIDILLSYITVRTLPKRTRLLSAGQFCDCIWFVSKGLIREFYEKDTEVETKQINSFFFPEGTFCMSPASMGRRIESQVCIETLEETTVLEFQITDLYEMYRRVPMLNYIARQIFETRLGIAHDIIAMYILDTPEYRATRLYQTYPSLKDRISDVHLASYLGITPKSLSRIKNRIYNKDKKVSKEGFLVHNN
jgi:CRP-like cAMP-binding protein